MRLIFLSVLLLIVLTLLIFVKPIRSITESMYASTIYNIMSIESIFQNIDNVLKPKEKLVRENQKLRTELQETKVISQAYKVLLTENNNLKSMLGGVVGNSLKEEIEKTNAALAVITSYRNSVYGTILVKSLSSMDVQEGDLVHFGKMGLGTVARVNGDDILVDLFSSTQKTTEVTVNGIPAFLHGTSNNTGEIILSRAEKISLGDIVSIPRYNGFIFGMVEHIKHDTEEATQKLMVRMPVKVSDLQFVSISNVK